MKRRFFSMLPTILFLGLLAALVTVRSVTSAQSIHSMAIEPGYLAQYRRRKLVHLGWRGFSAEDRQSCSLSSDVFPIGLP